MNSKKTPIWNNVCSGTEIDIDDSYGRKQLDRVDVYVGDSTRYSAHLVEHKTKRSNGTYSGKSAIFFQFIVDGIVLKEIVFEDKLGRCGEILKIKNRLKPLLK